MKKIFYFFSLIWASLSSNALLLDLLSSEMEPCELDADGLEVDDDEVLELCDFKDFCISERGLSPTRYDAFARIKAKVVIFKSKGKYFIFQIQRNSDGSIKRVPFSMSGEFFYLEKEHYRAFAIKITKEGSKFALKIGGEKQLVNLMIRECKVCNIQPIKINLQNAHFDFQSWFIIPLHDVEAHAYKSNHNPNYMYNDLYNTTKGILIKGINSDTAFICKFNGPKCKVTAFSDQYYRCHTHVNGKRVIITKTGDELVLS